jgi:hypothetical protein
MDRAVARTEAGRTRAAAFAHWATRREVLTAGLVAFVLVLAGVRVWLSSKILTPWIMSDELLYSELARSFADQHQLLVRGANYHVYNAGYPILISPAWLAGSMSTTYALAKAINVVLMTIALVPVYLWSLRLVRWPYALVATGLVALLPAFVYTGELMTENGSLPATMLAFFVIALMLERPTLFRQLLALLTVGLAFFMRAQGLVLFAVLPAAVVLKIVLDARAAKPGARRRTFVHGWRGYLPLIGIYVVGGLMYIAYETARGMPLSAGLGAYAGVTSAEYPPSVVAHWTVEHFGELCLALGIFPVSALIVLLVRALGRGTESPAERAFLAVSATAVPLFVVQVAAYASWFSQRVEDRYICFVFPLILIALVVWLDRGLPRPRVTTAVAAIVPVALLLFLPLEKRLNVSIISDTFGFIPLLRLSYHVSIPTVRTLMIVAGIGGALMFGFVPRRFGPVVFPVVLAVYLATASVAVFKTVREFAVNSRAGLAPADLTWIDDSLPKGASTGVIYGSTADPFGEAQRMWQAEFWNRDVKRVYNLTAEPTSFAKTPIAIEPLTSTLVPEGHKRYPYDYALAAGGLDLTGVVVKSEPPWTLYKVRAPLRMNRVVEHVYPDGWMGTFAALTQQTGKGGRLKIRLSREAWGGPDVPGRVTIDVGRPVLISNGQLRIKRILARRTWVIHRGRARTFDVPVPKPPYRVEVNVRPTFSPADFGQPDTRELGAQLSFGRAPGTR